MIGDGTCSCGFILPHLQSLGRITLPRDDVKTGVHSLVFFEKQRIHASFMPEQPSDIKGTIWPTHFLAMALAFTFCHTHLGLL